MDKSGSMPTCPQWTYQRPIKCDKHPHVTNTVPEFVTCGWLPPKATSLSQRVANASGAHHGAQPHSMLWRRWLDGFTGDGTMPTRLASLTCPLHWILSYIFPNEELRPWIILTMFFYMKHVPSQADRPAVTRSHCDPGHPLNPILQFKFPWKKICCLCPWWAQCAGITQFNESSQVSKSGYLQNNDI